MKIKVCYNNEIHRLARVPDTLESLLHLVSTIFHAELPTAWGLQYTDSDGDNIRIASEKDYEEFRNSENSSTAIAKVHVVAIDGGKQPEIAPEEVIIVENDNKEDEEYQVIQSEEKKDLVPPVEVAESKQEEVVIQKQEEPVEVKEEQIKEPVEKKVYVDMETLEKLVSAMIEKSLPKISEFTQQQIEKQKGSDLQGLLSADDSILSGLDQPSKPLKAPHYGVRCDGCSVSPIMGIRYKCEKCPDFDLCEKCEAEGKHSHHNFIKMKEQSLLSSVRPVFSNKESECFFKPESCFEMKELKMEEPREVRNVKESMPTAQEITYYDNLVEKVRKLLKVFPQAKFDLMCVFVNEAPEDLDLEELIENYKH